MEESNIKIYKKRKRKIKKSIIILAIWILLFFCLTIYGLIKIILWFKDSQEIKRQIDDINDSIEVIELDNKESTEIINPPENKEDIYWDYTKLSLIDVNFKELLEKNSDTVGWLKIEGTNVNYPIVQTTDNSYYLTRDFNKKKNKGGWIFLDYRNNINNLNNNTIIYGHGLLNKAMFGSLKNTLKSTWYKNTDNHIIRLSTPTENTMWQIFSIYTISVTSDYLQINFSSDIEYLRFLTKLKKRSTNKFNTTINERDIILTLSTCDNNIGRLVIHAKLIKKEVDLTSKK